MRQHVAVALAFLGSLGCSGKDPAFDLAYPAEWRFSVEGPVSGYLMIINTGESPLNLETLQVSAITDDHATASVTINTTPSATTIPAGQAGGFITPLSKAVLVDSGLVKETRADTNSDYLTIELANAPEGTYDIGATMELSLDGITTILPMTIHVVPGPTIFANPEVGKRLKIYR